jgi:hypothetical protein
MWGVGSHILVHCQLFIRTKIEKEHSDCAPSQISILLQQVHCSKRTSAGVGVGGSTGPVDNVGLWSYETGSIQEEGEDNEIGDLSHH